MKHACPRFTSHFRWHRHRPWGVAATSAGRCRGHPQRRPRVRAQPHTSTASASLSPTSFFAYTLTFWLSVRLRPGGIAANGGSAREAGRISGAQRARTARRRRRHQAAAHCPPQMPRLEPGLDLNLDRPPCNSCSWMPTLELIIAIDTLNSTIPAAPEAPTISTTKFPPPEAPLRSLSRHGQPGWTLGPISGVCGVFGVEAAPNPNCSVSIVGFNC